jgi:hypothetical protein
VYYAAAHGDGQTTGPHEEASMWVAAQDLPRSAAPSVLARLNQILDQHDFDRGPLAQN